MEVISAAAATPVEVQFSPASISAPGRMPTQPLTGALSTTAPAPRLPTETTTTGARRYMCKRKRDCGGVGYVQEDSPRAEGDEPTLIGSLTVTLTAHILRGVPPFVSRWLTLHSPGPPPSFPSSPRPQRCSPPSAPLFLGFPVLSQSPHHSPPQHQPGPHARALPPTSPFSPHLFLHRRLYPWLQPRLLARPPSPARSGLSASRLRQLPARQYCHLPRHRPLCRHTPFRCRQRR